MPRVLAVEDQKTLEHAAQILSSGRLVVLPTDTVYGVGAHALLPAAVRRLYEAKGRPKDRAIPLLVATTDRLSDIVSPIPPVAHSLMDAFWPGGLTLVMHSTTKVPSVLTAGRRTVALRMPNHPFVRELIEAIEAPLAATSANISGQPPATTAEEALHALGGAVDLIVDGGTCTEGIASTIVDLTTSPPRILRDGAIPREDLQRLVPHLI